MENREYREKDYIVWLKSFKEYWGSLITNSEGLHEEVSTIEYVDRIDKVAKLLVRWYEETLEAKVRRKLIQRNDIDTPIVDHYKIISGTELCIMHILPVSNSDDTKRRILNAHLSVFIGNNILGDWEEIDVNDVSQGFKEIEYKHFLWLSNFDPSTNYPIIHNSLFWNSKSEHIKQNSRLNKRMLNVIRKIFINGRNRKKLISSTNTISPQ